ncbi:MAG: hypothetical protein IKO43_04500 [Kiritimatiellae bacterium]|nr:hypothetical protein [Kiritimatiellia bacterium]
MTKAKAVAITAVCLAVISASVAAAVVWQRRDSVARAQLRIAESREEAAKSAARQALSEEKAAAANESARNAELRTAEENRIAREAEHETQVAAAQKAASDAEAARENRAAREAEADAAEDLKAAEKAKADAAKAEADRAKALADAEIAKADAAAAKAEQERLAAQRVADELKLWEMKQLDLLTLEQELNDYKKELDEREIALRPEKTIKDLVNVGGNDKAKAEDDPAALLPENNKELPRASRRLARAERIMGENAASRSERSREMTLEKLEALYVAAVREDRVPDADFYRATIKSMYPDWVYKPKKTDSEAAAGEGESK